MAPRPLVTQVELSPIDRLVGSYVDRARALPQVETIILDGPIPGEGRIWTIISSPPFVVTHRAAVYDAQAEALRAVPDAAIDFRLVNLQELAQDPVTVLPDGPVLYQRPHPR